MAFIVARGFSVVFQGSLLMPGDEVPSGLKSLADLVASGHVVKTEDRTGDAESEPKTFKEPPALKPDSVVLESGARLPSPQQSVGEITGGTVSAKPVEKDLLPRGLPIPPEPPMGVLPPLPPKPVKAEDVPAPGRPSVLVGKWNVDPTTLEGKSLEQLNVMVLERDPSMKPFDTAAEAKAQLALDRK